MRAKRKRGVLRNLMDYQYYKTECRKCRRKILVEWALFGIPHQDLIGVTCADCLGEINADFRRERPEAARDIE